MKTLTGWIKSIRESKKIHFLAVTDGSKDLQVTLKLDDCIILKTRGELKVGASFIAIGEDSTTPKGLYEFVAKTIEVTGGSDDDFPIQPKYHTSDFLRTIPELRGRTKQFQAVWKIRHHLTQAIHRFLEDEGFYQYYTPIITQADCEGAGETFDVKTDWLEEKLTVSGQLHGEVGMMSLGKIYTFSPCFRAEKSATIKHLSEFWMIEPEMSFYDLKATVEFAEKFVKYIIQYVLLKCKYEFSQLEIDVTEYHSIISRKWIVLRYVDVCQQFGLEYGEDISSELEKKLVEAFTVPVFVTEYPKELKPFYMKKDDSFAKCFDLIFPTVGELIGGSEREDDYETLKKAMQDASLDLEKMQWYLATRKWGSVPHSGFGLGFERLILYLTKMSKIHDTIPFPISY